MIDLSSFLSALPRLTAADLAEIAAATSADSLSADEEVAWWRSMLSVDHVLRRHGQARAAGIAAAQARAAVVDAAAGAGDGVSIEVVTQVARSAGYVARACVAGPGAEWWLPTMLRGWDGFLARCDEHGRVPAA